MNDSLKTYWTAFYTKPRNEKKVYERLLGQGFEIYCPTRTVLKQWSDRKKKVKEPVFTSYVFARVNELLRSEILKDVGIVSNVFWLRKPVVIRDEEILEIKAFLEEFPAATLKSVGLSVGDRIEVDSGPLNSQKGIIRKLQGNKAFLLIASLGIEFQAEINVAHLKKVV